MANKKRAKKATGRVDEGYIPSDYRHVEAVLDKKAEEMLERLYGPDWKEQLNRYVEPPR